MYEFLSWVAGCVLGAIFFGGLWWTIRQALPSKQPAVWFLGSLLLRTAVVMAGFYVVAGGGWPRLVPCLIGFVVARLVVTWLTRPVQESAHAH